MPHSADKAYSPAKVLKREIKALTRRRDFLGQRLAQYKTDWDLAEFRALKTAIALMEREYENLPRPVRTERSSD
jgi:hypothetical protein